MMSGIRSLLKKHEQWLSVTFCVLFAVCLSSCAGTPSPDPAGPRASDAYPFALVEEESRREAMLAAWAGFTTNQGIINAPAPELQPVTATIRSIPALTQPPLYLPSVGEGVPMTEEETRESLRRFIAEAGGLLCGDREQLSLVRRVDGADGVKEAHYSQRAFRYGLRGGYGELRISFTPDRRVTQIYSTCVPEVERIRRGFVGLGQIRMPLDKALEGIVGQTVTYTDSSGQQQTFVIPEKEKINIKDSVTYPVMRVAEPKALQFYIALELSIDSAPGLAIYLDVVTGKILGTEQLGQPQR